jgi:hypothetical protein
LAAVFIASHSPHLVQRAAKGINGKPHYLFLGDISGPANLEAWLKSRRVEEVEATTCDEIAAAAEQRRRDIETALTVRKNRLTRAKMEEVADLRRGKQLWRRYAPENAEFNIIDEETRAKACEEFKDFLRGMRGEFTIGNVFLSSNHRDIAKALWAKDEEVIRMVRDWVEGQIKRGELPNTKDSLALEKMDAVLFYRLYEDDHARHEEILNNLLSTLSVKRFIDVFSNMLNFGFFEPSLLRSTLVEKQAQAVKEYNDRVAAYKIDVQRRKSLNESSFNYITDEDAQNQLETMSETHSKLLQRLQKISEALDSVS